MDADRITYEEGGWHFTCARSPRDGTPSDRAFIALAKREPFVNFHPIREPGEVWFEFGATATEALSKLTAEVATGTTGNA